MAETPEDRVFTRKLGSRIREAREARGWTRLELCQRLPSGIGDRTLLSYEHGVRQLSVVRIVEICKALGNDPGALLNLAVRDTDNYHTAPMPIDLPALIGDTTEDYPAVHAWAKSRLEDAFGETGVVVVAPAVVETLARVTGCPHRTLAAYLTNFLARDPPHVH
jgi:transcriptional regulator with XRE-family HTH domain